MDYLEKITTNDIALFTDIHYGLKGDSELRLKIADDFIYKKLIPHIKSNGIKYVIFGGDMFHNRNSVNVNTMNHVIDAIKEITKHAKLYMIIGNHDLYLTSSTEISSIRAIESMTNVTIVKKPELLQINGKSVLLVPWLSDLSDYGKESVDMMIGHFDISSKYLIASYLEEQKIKSFESSDKLIDSLLKSGTVKAKQIQKTDDCDIKMFTDGSTKKQNPDKFLGSYIDICKRGGYIFSGHIHPHKKFITKGRTFTFISSPFENDWGDIGKGFGFYNLNMHTDNHLFIESVDAPKHIEIKMSEITDEYEFNVSGNFVKLFVDCDIDYKDLNDTISKINSLNPLEPCIINYQHKVSFNDVDVTELDQMSSDNFSKSNYIVEYINMIEDSDLDEKCIDRTELKTAALEYYKKAEEKLKG